MVSALVPCYGDLHVVTRSLPRLLGRTTSDLEVVLVNNDTRQLDGLRNLVASMGDARVRVLELEHGSGFIRAINAGIAATEGKLVFFANSDLFLGDGYVDELVSFFERNPQAGCATGKVLRYDVDRNRETSVIDTAGHAIGRDRGAFDRGENELDVGQYELEEQVFGVSAAALVARREALESVRVAGEYLDETFFMYKEDVDLSWRIRLAGWECWYVPSAVAYHARTSRAPRLEGGRSPFRSFHENEKRKPRLCQDRLDEEPVAHARKERGCVQLREGLSVRTRPRVPRPRLQRGFRATHHGVGSAPILRCATPSPREQESNQGKAGARTTRDPALVHGAKPGIGRRSRRAPAR